MDGWMERCMYFYMYEYVWMDEWTIGRQTDGRIDGWVERRKERRCGGVMGTLSAVPER